MKKVGILLILICLFTVCLVAGFKITNLFFPNPASPTRNNDPNTRQQNLILIHVSDLKNPKPDLVSVWVLFLYYSDTTPNMIFSPVYPGRLPSQQILDFKDQFSLLPDGSVGPQFKKLLQNHLNIAVDGYLVLDDYAASVFFNKFLANPPSPEPYIVLSTDESKVVNSLCALVKTEEGRHVSLPWNEVLPDHFRTDLNFSSFMANWIRLTQAASPPHCELIEKH
jgi:hypothetical protein